MKKESSKYSIELALDISNPDISVLISKLSLKEAQEFIKRIIKKDLEIAKDLKIFVQGKEESKITMEDYYLKFKKELSQISPESLLESFHFFEQQNDYDYWDNDGGYDADNNLSEWVDEIIHLTTKYSENNNRKEALKIYFSAIQAYFECGLELEKKYSELGDWVEVAGSNLLNSMNNLLSKLPKEHFDFVADKLTSFVRLKVLKSHKSDFLSCLSNLYYKFEAIAPLKKLAEKHMVFYPPIALNLLNHLKLTENYKQLHVLSEKALSLIPKEKDFFSFKPDNYYDNEDFEIKIRKLLINTFDKKNEYKLMIVNLEKLFQISKEINDYKLLQVEYKSLEEKSLFLERIERIFSKNSDINELFNVFKIENRKAKILKLAQKHFEEECLHQMIEFLKDVYPKECFDIYQTKISKLLEVADTGRYVIICKDLLKMRKIGLDSDFNLYVNNIKDDFYKRRRLMEEMEKYKL